MRNKTLLQSLCLGLAFATQHAAAALVVSCTGPFDSWIVLYSRQAFAVSWEQEISYQNVAVSAELTAFGLTNQTGRAFLSSSIGTEAATDGLIASTTFAFPSTASDVLLFSGLNLAPGTYYLSLVGDSASWGSGWITSDASSHTTAAGATIGSSFGFRSPELGYLPSSAVFDGGSTPHFTVAGTAIPEPSTFGLIAGIAVLLCSVSRRLLRRQ